MKKVSLAIGAILAVALVWILAVHKTARTPALASDGHPWKANAAATPAPQPQTAPLTQAGNPADFGKPYYAKAFRLLFEGPGNVLGLSQQQIDFLQDRYTKLVEDRLAFERSIAHIRNANGNSAEIEIPAYAEAGKELQVGFYSSLDAEFGQALTEQIQKRFGEMIDFDNHLFGQEPQTLLVVADSANGIYAIKHTVISSIFDRTIGSEVSPSNPGEYKLLMPLFPKL